MSRKILQFMYFILIFVPMNDSRGGRGRSGGGIFSNWRKGKSSGSNTYRSSKTTQNFNPFIQANREVFQFYKRHIYDVQKQPYMQLYPKVSYLNVLPKEALYYPYSSDWDLSEFNLWYENGQILARAIQQTRILSKSQEISTNDQNKFINLSTIQHSQKQEMDSLWLNELKVPLTPLNESLLKYTMVNKLADSTTNQTHTLGKIYGQKTSNGFMCKNMTVNNTVPLIINTNMDFNKLVCVSAPYTLINSCLMRTFIETDYNEPHKLIRIIRPLCPLTKKEQKESIIGDIVEKN